MQKFLIKVIIYFILIIAMIIAIILGIMTLNLTLLIISIIIGIIAIPTFIILAISTIKYTSVHRDTSFNRIELYTLKNSTSINGNMDISLFSGYGYIRENDIYKFIYQNSDGSLHQASIPTNKTTIYFISDKQLPYLITKIHTNYNLFKKPISKFYSYELHIHKKAISQEIKIDLKK